MIMFQSRMQPSVLTLPMSPVFGSESSIRRFSRGLLRRMDRGLGRLLGIPLPSGRLNLNFWTVDPLGLSNYEARHLPLSLHLRASWFTLLYWQNLLDDYRPEPWAPAIIHMEVDLRETVTV